MVLAATLQGQGWFTECHDKLSTKQQDELAARNTAQAQMEVDRVKKARDRVEEAKAKDRLAETQRAADADAAQELMRLQTTKKADAEETSDND